jgi:hypothetical protein
MPPHQQLKRGLIPPADEALQQFGIADAWGMGRINNLPQMPQERPHRCRRHVRVPPHEPVYRIRVLSEGGACPISAAAAGAVFPGRIV